MNRKQRRDAEREQGPQLVVDDARDLQAIQLVHGGPVTFARTFDEAKQLLFDAMAFKRPPWDVLYMDHDLGDPRPGHTGYDLLKWIHEYSRPERLPRVVKVVTANVAVWEHMNGLARQIEMQRANAK